MLILGTPFELDDPVRQKVLTYKNDYLYDDEYKECRQNTQLYIFDEPMSCTSADYITFVLESVTKQQGDTTIKLKDSIHPERSLELDNGVKVTTISNKRGDVFSLEIFAPIESLTRDDMRDISRHITRKVGAPNSKIKGSDVNVKWISPDGFDISLSTKQKGYFIEIIARDGYKYLNSYNHVRQQS